MSAYVIALIEIHDRDVYQKYLDGFNAVFDQYNGEILVVDDAPSVFEGEWPYTRTVVIRFPDENEAKRWYESDAYQALAQYRFQAAKTNFILAKGRK